MQSTKDTISLIQPQDRLKHLLQFCNAVDVDFHIPPSRYYRSGLEMVRMASVYYQEGNLENAYILYLKFMTLFLEKIRQHPDFDKVPLRMKAMNKATLREVLPKAEKLKQELLKLYELEYRKYVAEEKKKKHEEKGRDTRSRKYSPSLSLDRNVFTNDVKLPPSIDGVSYPDITTGQSNTSVQNVTDERGKSTVIREPIVPAIDRSKKPSIIFDPHFKSHDLRKVVVPERVMTQFEIMAQRNTINNIETCGILAGHLARNELIVTHMILPKQKGTSDSCATMNEEELFDFQDQQNLITIGWIHTHPTQTAFLSSVDLHTHCPYQLLMPEAIAIVIAPKYKETGFFVLTPEYGLSFIAKCRETGFHPHPTEPPLFMIAEHVQIDNSASLDVLDLRVG